MPDFTDILAGWDELIAECFQLKHGLNTRNSSSLIYDANSDLHELFDDLYRKLEQNFANGKPSANIAVSNWELRHALKISESSTSLEKLMEKRVAELSNAEAAGAEDKKGWFNQMPAASDYAGQNKNRKNSIDLVYQAEHGREYHFVELKVLKGSGYPVYAAFELLSYGFLYCFTRSNPTLKGMFEELNKPVLRAETIRLIVLAPNSYFDENQDTIESVRKFERAFNAALGIFAAKQVPNLEMTFEFMQFLNPVSTKAEIEAFSKFEFAPFD